MNYDYKCNCGRIREIDHKMSENPIVNCGFCGTRMKRIITTAPGIIVNCEGFCGTTKK